MEKVLSFFKANSLNDLDLKKEKNGFNPLQFVLRFNKSKGLNVSPQDLDYLLKNSDLNQVFDDGWSALMVALTNNKEISLTSDQWDYLINNSNLKQINVDGFSPLMLLFNEETFLSEKHINAIFDASDLTVTAKRSATPLISFLSQYSDKNLKLSKDRFEKLLKSNDLNQAELQGWLPFHIVVRLFSEGNLNKLFDKNLINYLIDKTDLNHTIQGGSDGLLFLLRNEQEQNVGLSEEQWKKVLEKTNLEKTYNIERMYQGDKKNIKTNLLSYILQYHQENKLQVPKYVFNYIVKELKNNSENPINFNFFDKKRASFPFLDDDTTNILLEKLLTFKNNKLLINAIESENSSDWVDSNFVKKMLNDFNFDAAPTLLMALLDNAKSVSDNKVFSKEQLEFIIEKTNFDSPVFLNDYESQETTLLMYFLNSDEIKFPDNDNIIELQQVLKENLMLILKKSNLSLLDKDEASPLSIILESCKNQKDAFNSDVINYVLQNTNLDILNSTKISDENLKLILKELKVDNNNKIKQLNDLKLKDEEINSIVCSLNDYHLIDFAMTQPPLVFWALQNKKFIELTHSYSDDYFRDALLDAKINKIHLSPEVALNLIESKPTLYKYLPISLKNNIDISLFAIRKNENNVKFIGKELKEFLLITEDNAIEVLTDNSLKENVGLFNFFKKKKIESLQEKIDLAVEKSEERKLDRDFLISMENKQRNLSSKEEEQLKGLFSELKYMLDLGLENLDDYDNSDLKKTIENNLFVLIQNYSKLPDRVKVEENDDGSSAEKQFNKSLITIKEKVDSLNIKIETKIKVKVAQEAAVVSFKDLKDEVGNFKLNNEFGSHIKNKMKI